MWAWSGLNKILEGLGARIADFRNGMKAGKLHPGTRRPVVLSARVRSDVKSGLSFAPALRAHQRTQRRDGADRRQQKKACNEEKSTLHIVHRERPHDFTPHGLIVPLQSVCQPHPQRHDSSGDFFLRRKEHWGQGRIHTWEVVSHIACEAWTWCGTISISIATSRSSINASIDRLPPLMPKLQ